MRGRERQRQQDSQRGRIRRMAQSREFVGYRGTGIQHKEGGSGLARRMLCREDILGRSSSKPVGEILYGRILSCSVRPMGGKLVLLDCKDKNELRDLVKLGKDWLSQWFEDVRPWTPNMIACERFVWLRCQGVPLQAWGEEFFTTLACIWGKFICLDDSTSARKRFNIGRFLISTSTMDFISKSLSIKVNGRPVNVKITEEESTNGIFRMKSDFNPCFASDFDGGDDESWSLESSKGEYMEDEQFEPMQSNEIPSSGVDKKDDEVAKADRVKDEMTVNLVPVEDIRCQDINGSLDSIKDGVDMSARNTRTQSEAWKIAKDSVVGAPNSNLICSNGEMELNNAVIVEKAREPFGEVLGLDENGLGERDMDLVGKENGLDGIDLQRPIENQLKVPSETQDVVGRNPGIEKKKRRSKLETAIPVFNASKDNRVASESVGDNGIANYNRDRMKQESNSTLEIWNFAKKIRVVAKGNEEEVVQQIERMERRDKTGKETATTKDTANGNAGDGLFGVFGFWGPENIPVYLVNVYAPFRNSQEFTGSKRQQGLIDSLSQRNGYLIWETVFDAWFESPNFKECVTEEWRAAKIHKRKGFILKEKLKKLKASLKVKSKNLVTETENKIKVAKENIEKLDLVREFRQLTESEKDQRKSSTLELWNNLKAKESIWRQKVRRQWIRDGDANTCFFHRCAKGRWRRNEINNLMVDRRQLVEVNKIKEGVATYFEKMFMEEEWVRPTLEGLRFSRLSTAQNEFLISEFEEKEVQKAIWECDGTKAPSPDGFNFNFIKSMWEVLKEDIMAFVQEFHNSGRMNRGLNSSFMVLIPKLENPQRIEEFRPISLIHSMYKIIAKLLANRLRQVMDHLIREQQMAFLSDRQLCEVVVIANEVLDEAKRKKTRSFAFKVDFEKAYDKGLEPLCNIAGSGGGGAGWRIVCIPCIWCIWLARNERIFKGSLVETNRLFELVQMRSYHWLKGKLEGSYFNYNEWSADPLLCMKSMKKKKIMMRKQ
ncbi:hypothetical protein SLEP1_g23841 [Rubroshorea leprosula]|uniref:Reverse transcriptase domain-containing protein n=1 Tax=Rubroshorea leprosula TaxID=152421 RepID=A0AAV5JDV2_9ROSI|nr:hypothetical protein SLEP1_g23841 [Rubroshorea leprosula]